MVVKLTFIVANFGEQSLKKAGIIAYRLQWNLFLTTALRQLSLERGLAATEGRQTNLMHQEIQIGAGIRTWIVGQPNVLVPLFHPLYF